MAETKENTATATEQSPQEHSHDHDHAHEHRPLGECEREITVEVPADVFEKEFDRQVQRYQKLARIPGFRKGKVPATLIRNRFSSEINSEVIESLLPNYFRQEVDKQNLKPISQPRIYDLQMNAGAPLRFKAAFEVLPEIEVAGYESLSAEKGDVSVSEKEVEDELNGLREQQASYDAIDEDRPLRDGDWAMVSFTGTPKAEPRSSGLVDAAGNPIASSEQATTSNEKPPVQMDEVLVEIGGANTVKDFTENLRGAKATEERTFEVSYPADYNEQRLAGKTLVYKVEIKGIKKKSLPELDDAFAKELGDFQDLADLRSKLRQRMEANKRHQIEHAAKDKLIEELVERNNFPVPESLIDQQTNSRLERGFRALAAQGMRVEDIKNMDMQRLKAGQREAAIREVKASLILDKIAQNENIETTEEDLNQELERLALQTKQPVEALRQRLTREGALDRIRDRIRNEKTLDYLYQRSA
ncbi:MAG TPA: trigger factor [Terriglobales bacterium]